MTACTAADIVLAASSAVFAGVAVTIVAMTLSLFR